MNVNRIISRILYPKLTTAAERSAMQFQQMKEKNVFRSKTLQELLSDRFEYKGNEPNIILIKDKTTGNPVEVFVDIKQDVAVLGDIIREEYSIWTKDKKSLLGEKDFFIKKVSLDNVCMVQGNMENCNPLYSGVGIRLDQMQIERALQLGIKSIPRTSYPQAIIFHTKMGFLPLTTQLIKLKNLKVVNKFSEHEFKLAVYDIPVENMRSNPFVVKMDGEYYLDVNKTVAMSSVDMCEDILANTNEGRVLGLDISGIRMSLRGEELEHWKDIIKEHPILSRLKNPPKNPFYGSFDF